MLPWLRPCQLLTCLWYQFPYNHGKIVKVKHLIKHLRDSVPTCRSYPIDSCLYCLIRPNRAIRSHDSDDWFTCGMTMAAICINLSQICGLGKSVDFFKRISNVGNGCLKSIANLLSGQINGFSNAYLMWGKAALFFNVRFRRFLKNIFVNEHVKKAYTTPP